MMISRKIFGLVLTWFLVGFLFHTVLIGKDLVFSAPILGLVIIIGVLKIYELRKYNND